MLSILAAERTINSFPNVQCPITLQDLIWLQLSGLLYMAITDYYIVKRVEIEERKLNIKYGRKGREEIYGVELS